MKSLTERIFLKKRKRKKGFLIIKRRLGVQSFFPPYTVTPMKRIQHTRTMKEAKRKLKKMKKERYMYHTASTEIKKSYGYGKTIDKFIESFRFENVLTGKKWRKRGKRRKK